MAESAISYLDKTFANFLLIGTIGFRENMLMKEIF
jgi:hypothetical protein